MSVLVAGVHLEVAQIENVDDPIVVETPSFRVETPLSPVPINDSTNTALEGKMHFDNTSVASTQ